jgi:hypothetical protein
MELFSTFPIVYLITIAIATTSLWIKFVQSLRQTIELICPAISILFNLYSNDLTASIEGPSDNNLNLASLDSTMSFNADSFSFSETSIHILYFSSTFVFYNIFRCLTF